MKYLLFISLFLPSLVFSAPSQHPASSADPISPYDAPAIHSRQKSYITENSTILKASASPYMSPSIVSQSPQESSLIITTPSNHRFTGKRSLILSSSYFHYSSRGLADFAISLSDSFEWLGDKIIAKTSPTSRPFVGCLFTLGALYVYHRYATAFHEMGHGLHYRARGGTFGLYSEGTPNNEVKGKKK